MSRTGRTIGLFVAALVGAATVTAEAGSVKVGGEPIFPSELVFIDADPKSQAHGEGTLANGCKWEVDTITRFAAHHSVSSCVRYFYRTTITLTKKCPAPNRPLSVTSERITATGPHCAGDDGEIPSPRIEARSISSGRTPGERSQNIVEQPDGSRVIISWSDDTVDVRVTYPDRTTDILKLPEE